MYDCITSYVIVGYSGLTPIDNVGRAPLYVIILQRTKGYLGGRSEGIQSRIHSAEVTMTKLLLLGNRGVILKM